MNSRVDRPLPQITDIPSGMEYLGNLALASPAVAEQQLLAFIDALLAEPPDSGVLFHLLEQMRVPLGFVEEEMARRYHNKAVPLSSEEETAFRQVTRAWQQMARAYALCAQLEEPAAGDGDYQALMATILHRCLYYTGMVVLEHYRARRDLPPGVWLDLHGYYATAEEWGIACLPVSDALESSLQATHCTAAYVTLLLIDVASPYSLSVRDLNLIRRWANMWAPLVAVSGLDDDLQMPSYVIELMKDAPLHPGGGIDAPAGDVRVLDTARLGLQINHALSQLRARISPARLGLGEEGIGHVSQLLEHVLRPWTQSASPRRFRRFDTVGVAKVGSGFEALHYFVSGREFEQPDAALAYSRADFDALFTFRERVEPGQTLLIKPHASYPAETWSVINHSANGFRLARSLAGLRISHNQLLALCPHDGEHYLLVRASWLMQEEDGGLIIGVATLPGMPRAVAVRPYQKDVSSVERYVPAFILPPVPAIGEEGSLVIPSGMYQAARYLEVVTEDRTARLRMNHVLDRGSDFDRVSYIES